MTFRTVTLTFTMATLILSVGSAPAQSFTPTTTPMTSPRILHTATLLLDGKVLVTGGDNVSTAEIFDPAAGSFSLTGSPKVARSFHTATLLSDGTGRVLITGGRDAFGGGAIQSAEIFDPTGNGGIGSFSFTDLMGVARTKHTATLLLDGRVLITGGNSLTAEIFDPTGNGGVGSFSPTGSMAVVRNRHTATLLADDTVLVAGGEGPAFGLLNTAEIYDPVKGTFGSTNGELTEPRGADHTATLLSDDTVLLVGGRQANPPFTIRTADLYDPIAKTFTEANGVMPGARNFHTATLLNDETVLIAGGQIAGQVNTFRAIIYELVFSETAHMTTQRDFHKATLLLDGKVLITGGFGPFTGGGNPILSSAEVFTP